MPGKEWVSSFLQRHTILNVRFASAKGQKLDQQLLKNIFRIWVNNCNIWNYDETNLTDEPGHKKVVTKRGCKYPERIINSTKSSVSLMFCGNAEGELLPPYVVYKAEFLWNTWMVHGPKMHVTTGQTQAGLIAIALRIGFLHFCCHELKKSSGKHVVIGDNLSSHINIAVLQACQQNNIAFVSLPPNATHLAQTIGRCFLRPGQ